MQDLATGQIDLFFGGPEALPLARAGSIKAYAVTSETRWALAPEVPTFAELGYDRLDLLGWFGMLMPAGTTNAVVAKMSLGIHDVLLDPAIKSAIIDMGLEPIGSTPAEFADVIDRDYLRWQRLITEVGARPEAQ